MKMKWFKLLACLVMGLFFMPVQAEASVLEPEQMESIQGTAYTKEMTALWRQDGLLVRTGLIAADEEVEVTGLRKDGWASIRKDGTEWYIQTEYLTDQLEEVLPAWEGPVLTRSAGAIQGPSGKETYYNLDMSGIIRIMRGMGNEDEYWIREDGVKMLGDYVMVAANFSLRPRGSYVQTSLGMGIVVDTGGFAAGNPTQLDIATAW